MVFTGDCVDRVVWLSVSKGLIIGRIDGEGVCSTRDGEFWG